MKRMNEKCNWKKFTAIAAATVIGLSGMTACGGSEEAKEDSGEVTLTFALWDKLQKDGMEQMAAAFEKENPGIKIKVEMTPWDQYWTKMQASGAGDTLPDIFWMHPEQVYEYANGGKIMDMSELIENSSDVDMSKFPQNVVNDFNIDGKQYAIPKDYSTFGLWYNKDIFDEKGVAYPDDTWTWDTLQEAAEKLTDKEKGREQTQLNHKLTAVADAERKGIFAGIETFQSLAGGFVPAETRDRKSTRLNSSHWS